MDQQSQFYVSTLEETHLNIFEYSPFHLLCNPHILIVLGTYLHIPPLIVELTLTHGIPSSFNHSTFLIDIFSWSTS